MCGDCRLEGALQEQGRIGPSGTRRVGGAGARRAAARKLALRVGCARSGLPRRPETEVELVDIRSKAVFPAHFNRLIDTLDNKSTALSQVTLGLIRELIEPLPAEPIHVTCDKHGGRNRYGRLLQETFPDDLVEIHGEGRARSLYRWGTAPRRVEICFRTGGEAFLPAALASMASKYLRELAMGALNDFWRRLVVGLKPTAGYPVDAKRFKAEIRTVQEERGIEDRLLWRSR